MGLIGIGTEVSIDEAMLTLNGKPTYPGRHWRGLKIEGLLMNSRMVQRVFDDENPETRGRWAYPDNGAWDPDRNTSEFVEAMRGWRDFGLLAFTVNFQGPPRGILYRAAVTQQRHQARRLDEDSLPREGTCASA